MAYLSQVCLELTKTAVTQSTNSKFHKLLISFSEHICSI